MHRQCSHSFILTIVLAVLSAGSARSQDAIKRPTTADRPQHEESAQEHTDSAPPEIETPPLPGGMTLDQVLGRASKPPPEHWPATVPDDRTRVFTLFEQLEYRVALDDTPDHLGWDAQGWIGSDFNKFWWKSEGESVFDGPLEGEAETDLLYSRLFAPFWSFQLGAQYANEWTEQHYSDRWSGVVALEGLVPYKFEWDSSLYISEHGDITLEIEAEYDLRITQRLVLQPRVELGFAFQDVPERMLGAGMTDANLDLRLRYEIKREFAPYIGVRQRFLVGETRSIITTAGQEADPLFFVAGVRFAF